MIRRLLEKFFPCKGRRAIIVHNHLFKNAGTTIDWALRKNFGRGFVDHRDNAAMKGGTAYLAGYFRANPRVRALASHHLALPLPELEDVDFHLLMLLRHPLERVTSVYNFEREQAQAGTQGARFAREHDLREYVLWRMRPDVPPSIRNYQVLRALPGPVHRGEMGDRDLSQAKRFLESVPLLGIVEHFDESMLLFEETLRPVFPSIDFTYKPQNVRQDRRETQASRLERLQAEIGREAFGLLTEKNRVDLELYAHAQQIFQDRLGRIEGLDRKLQAFRERL